MTETPAQATARWRHVEHPLLIDSLALNRLLLVELVDRVPNLDPVVYQQALHLYHRLGGLEIVTHERAVQS